LQRTVSTVSCAVLPSTVLKTGSSKASMVQDRADDGSEEPVYFAAPKVPSEGSLRARQGYTRVKEDVYMKTPSMMPEEHSNGEVTEPEAEDLSTSPDARSTHYNRRSSQFLELLIPYVYEFCRFLSIVPATFGALYNTHKVYYLPDSKQYALQNTKLDYIICIFWVFLTGYQCLALTTGLLVRWRAYYPPLSTLIRLVALQGICWPATHITLVFFDHTKRPVLCWALIGTTTCLSRSIQLWVTSNIQPSSGRREGRGKGKGAKCAVRHWDWSEVTAQCILPAAAVYFVALWVTMLKEELLCYSSHSPP